MQIEHPLVYWIDNPVFQREIRQMLRGKAVIGLLVGCPILLAGAFFLLYSAHYFPAAFGGSSTPSFGREMFAILSFGLFALVMLLVPALVGTSVNKDRECGAWIQLELTPLGMWRTLFGKVGAFALLYSLVLLINLPILGLTVLAGGVSPQELVGLFLITLVTGIQCTMFSLIAGMVFRTNLTTMIIGFLLTLMYLLFLPGLPSALAFLANYLASGEGRAVVTYAQSVKDFLEEWKPYFLPAAAIQEVLSPGVMRTVWVGPLRLPIWLLSVLGIALTSSLSFLLAVWLGRLRLWTAPRRLISLKRWGQRKIQFSANNLLPDGRNALLSWEIRHHFVYKHRKIITFLVAVFCVFFLMYYIFVAQQQPQIFTFLIPYLLIVWTWCAIVPLFYCAQSVAKEKERGTYDSLILTLVEPRQIIEAKVKGSMLLVLPILLPAALVYFFAHFAPPINSSLGFFSIDYPNFVGLAYQILRSLYYSMLGIVFSLYCRSTSRALLLAVLVDLLLLVPFSFVSATLGCVSAALTIPISQQGTNLFLAIGIQYFASLLHLAVRGGLLILICRILYDRAVNLLRFEAYRR